MNIARWPERSRAKTSESGASVKSRTVTGWPRSALWEALKKASAAGFASRIRSPPSMISAGVGRLAQIAGPVGEALIMTGLGLAVAIPAVMAYNLYTRRNRVIASQLDAFAGELHTFVAMGQPLGSPESGTAAAPPPSTRATVDAVTAPAVAALRSGPVAA